LEQLSAALDQTTLRRKKKQLKMESTQNKIDECSKNWINHLDKTDFET
jgi:hypothetical protein